MRSSLSTDSSYAWSFAGDSLVGTSSLTNVSIMATLFSPFASGGTVNQLAIVNSASLTIKLEGAPVPLPGSLLLLGSGLGLLFGSRKTKAIA